MPDGSPGFCAGMYTWWYHKLPSPPHRSESHVGSWAASCSGPGTNVRSCTTSGIVSSNPGMAPLSMSFFSVSSAIRYPAAMPAYTFSRVMPQAWSW